MEFTKRSVFVGSALLFCGAAAASADDPATGAPAAQFSRCEAAGSGIEYRSYLPDQRRYVFISVKVLKGIHPSVFVLIDKNFDGKVADLSNKADPIVAWWLDRSRPFSFSADKIKIGWREGGVWHWVTSLAGPDGEAGLAQPIRGLAPTGDHFEGFGSNDNNTFAFQSRLELADFDGDQFSVFVPAVSYDGVRVTPPEIQFTETDGTPAVKC